MQPAASIAHRAVFIAEFDLRGDVIEPVSPLQSSDRRLRPQVILTAAIFGNHDMDGEQMPLTIQRRKMQVVQRLDNGIREKLLSNRIDVDSARLMLEKKPHNFPQSAENLAQDKKADNDRQERIDPTPAGVVDDDGAEKHGEPT